MIAHHCPTCERVFDSQRGLQVHHSRAHGEPLPNQRCVYCDAYFRAEHQRTYCSQDCRNRGTSFEGENNPNYSGSRRHTTCDLCDTPFEFYPSEKQGLYCSDCVENESWQPVPTATDADNPQWNGGKQTVECVVCSSSVERWPSELNQATVCTEDCREQWLSDSFTGDGHPNWKGGGNEAYGKGWAAVRAQALERDDYQCRVCGKSDEAIGRNPDVHHIRPVRSFIEAADKDKTDAHQLDNVISLCISCHRKADFGKITKARLRSLVYSPVPAIN